MELGCFAGVMVLGQFSPGPDMILLTRTALVGGARSGLPMAAGIASGLMVHATIAVSGVAVALRSSPGWSVALRVLAVAYLTWIAWNLLRGFCRAVPAGVDQGGDPGQDRSPYLRGLLCNLLNPKAALFLAAASAPFLVGLRPAWWPVAIWAIIVGLGLGLWSLWVLLLQWEPLRRGCTGAARWIDALFGAALLVLAARLALVG